MGKENVARAQEQNAQPKRVIQLNRPRFLETDIIPEVGDIVLDGIREELVVDDVPQNEDHGHLIKTAYRRDGKPIENTYLVEQRSCYTLTQLGSAEGFRISELYDEMLTQADL